MVAATVRAVRSLTSAVYANGAHLQSCSDDEFLRAPTGGDHEFIRPYDSPSFAVQASRSQGGPTIQRFAGPCCRR